MGGGDLDCAVSGLDPLWPLRLPKGWLLCQRLQYDTTGWYWVLLRDQDVIAVDTLEDPKGIGRHGFSSTQAFSDGPALMAPATARAAYLTAKRLEKGSTAPADWSHIGRLARDDPRDYRRALAKVVGPAVSRELAALAERGEAPPPDLRRRARRAQIRRRIQTPSRALEVFVRSVGRIADRVLRPTGLIVVVVGADGSGKSTLAENLPEACDGLFRRSLRVHWRPGLLPRPGALLARPSRDPSLPHAQPPHGRAASLALLGYYWLDSLAGGWTRLKTTQARTGLVLIERGWWDVAVDPGRYRLNVPPSAVRILGWFLPYPDLAIVLDAPGSVASERKAELPAEEFDRQTRAWSVSLPRAVPAVHLDARRPAGEVIEAARKEIVRKLSARAYRRLGAGWSSLPSRGRDRWLFPRGPRGAVHDSMLIYQPVTVRGRIGWEMARWLGSLGAFHLLPRGDAPASVLRDALAPHLPPRASLALSRANHQARVVAIVVADDDDPVVIKIATEDEGKDALSREARALTTLATGLPPPLSAPELLKEEAGVLVERAVRWRPRSEPWRMPIEVAFALGAFFRQGASRDAGVLAGPAHGDCAPWNLLRTDDSWVLVDWEDARERAPAFLDLFHYLVQSSALLRQPAPDAIIEGVHRRGWIGALVEAYADGAGVASTQAPGLLIAYLDASIRRLSPNAADGRAGIRARRQLLAMLQP